MTNKSTPVAVIVVAHRQYDTLSLCLAGFRSAVMAPRDLIFVDNSATGELSAAIKQALPDITTIALSENRLFCGGYNAGLRLAIDLQYEYALIVNADTELINPSFLWEAVRAMERYPRAAFVGPTVFYRTQGQLQNTVFTFPSVAHFVWSWLPFRLFPRLLVPDLTTEREVDALNGVCVLCRLRALKEVGLLDESFGAYVEDFDWSWRARQLGWTCVYSPISSIVHHEEHAGYEHFSFKTFLLKRNIVYWYIKTGRRLSARIYAISALCLARARALAASESEAVAYKEFARNLSLVYRHLLKREPLGPWFGPPLSTGEYGRALLAHPEKRTDWRAG